MSDRTKPRPRRTWLIVGGVLLALVLACGLAGGWWVLGLFGSSEPHQPPPKRGGAGGVGGGCPPHTGGAEHQGAVYVVDVTAGRVVHQTTLDRYVHALAWSPDGRGLAVGTVNSLTNSAPAGPPNLVVYDAATFAVKLSAPATTNSPSFGFIDLAWSPDGRSLYAVEGSDVDGMVGGDLRRWDRTEWKEAPLPKAKGTPLTAIAVSPDGTRLAGLDAATTSPRMIHLLDPDGTSTATIGTLKNTFQGRVGFSPDGQLIGVTDHLNPPEWFDIEKRMKVTPTAPRWATKPAAVYGSAGIDFDPTFAREARGERRNRPLGMLFGGDKDLGSFLNITTLASRDVTRWRLFDESHGGSAPVPAFSPDGSRLAVSGGGGELRVWDVGK
jgi:WD40 repeat protein